MTKMELNDKTREILYEKVDKVPSKLYKALLETHSALYSRALLEDNQFPVRTLEFFSKVYTELQKSCLEIGLNDDANKYSLLIKRTTRQLKRK